MGFNYEQYQIALAKPTNNYSNCDGWYNATGDVADLQAKLANLESNLAYNIGRRDEFQAKYDEADGRQCSGCGGRKQPKCHDRCWAKESDKANALNEVNLATMRINQIPGDIATTKIDLTNEINRVYQVEQKRLADENAERIRLAAIEQKRLDDLAKKEIEDARIAKEKAESDAAIEIAKKTAQDLADAKKKELEIKKEVDLKLVEKGVVPEAELKKAELAGQAVVEAAKINAIAQAKVTELTGVSSISNKKYLIIGGVILALGVVGYFVFKKD